MTTPDIDTEIARLIHALESKSTLAEIKAAVKLSKPKRARKPKAPPKSPAERHLSRLKGRVTSLRRKIAEAEAIVAHAKASPKDFGAQLNSCSAEASLRNDRATLVWLLANYSGLDDAP